MSNLIIQTEAMQDYCRKGMPDGGETLLRSINVLFARIEELEKALIPFARAGCKPNDGIPLVQVYHSDCATAFTKLSTEASRAAQPTAPTYMPAEAF